MSDNECCKSYNHDHSANHTAKNAISPVVNKCIKRIIMEEQFLDYIVDIKSISTNGGNYLANLQEIDLKGKSKHRQKEINLFVKNRLLDSEFDLIPFDAIYTREAFFYNDLENIYHQLQEKANVPYNERLRVAKSYCETNSDVTILENLRKKGFKTSHRLDPMSHQFAQMALKQLAKLHALSFVLRNKMPEYFENVIKPMRILFELNPDWDKYLETSCKEAASCFDSYTKGKLEKFMENMMLNYKRFINPPDDAATCLCHGDFRVNNLMMIETVGDIKDMITVDFQLIHYGSPVTDFIYFIFTGSDQKFRGEHLEDLMDLYYETFENFLRYFDIKAQDVYSRERFEEEYRLHLDHGLCSFLILAPFLFCSDDNVPDLQHGITDINISFNNPACRERLHGIVDDFMKWGYL